jgi:dipeptidyl aminopeptidase/acylaminoacyl peptidase
MGGSAGGFTALLVAASTDLVHGVIALYPVTDLLDLAATAHRFSPATTRLVGPLPDAVRLRERCPARRRDPRAGPPAARVGRSIRAPRQSERLWRLADCERHVYEGEGHGWRRVATVADELARIDAFLTQHALV